MFPYCSRGVVQEDTTGRLDLKWWSEHHVFTMLALAKLACNGGNVAVWGQVGLPSPSGHFDDTTRAVWKRVYIGGLWPRQVSFGWGSFLTRNSRTVMRIRKSVTGASIDIVAGISFFRVNFKYAEHIKEETGPTNNDAGGGLCRCANENDKQGRKSLK